MFEIAGIAVFLVAAFFVFAVLAAVGLLLKLAFKIVLLPFALIGWLFKGLLLVLALGIGLLIAPALLVVVMVLAVAIGIPLLFLAGLAGLVGAGFAFA